MGVNFSFSEYLSTLLTFPRQAFGINLNAIQTLGDKVQG